MKKSKIYFSLLVAVLATLASCTVTKRHYAPGYHVEWKNLSRHAISNEFAHVQKENVFPFSYQEPASLATPSEEMVASLEDVTEDILVSNENIKLKGESIASVPLLTKRKAKAISINSRINSSSNQPQSVLVQAKTSPESSTWLVYAVLVLFTWVFSGAILMMIYTSKKNGKIDWKPVLTSFLLWWCCGIPGLIYDIIWINKNCSGSLFND
jgi:hypothetical protein